MSHSLLKKHLTYARPSISNSSKIVVGNGTLSKNRSKQIENKVNLSSIVNRYQNREDENEISCMSKATEQLLNAKQNVEKVIESMKLKFEKDRIKIKRPNAKKNSGNPKKSSKKINNILRLYKKL